MRPNWQKPQATHYFDGYPFLPTQMKSIKGLTSYFKKAKRLFS